MGMNSEQAKKAAKKMLAKDPEHYRKIASKKRGVVTSGAFKKGNKYGSVGGSRSKRSKPSTTIDARDSLKAFKLEYEDMED